MMFQTLRNGLIPLVMAFAAVSNTVRAEDWPNWRGPQHDGISLEKLAKTDWTEPPKVLWEQPIGSAFSAFACVKDRVYTCGTKDKKQVLFCLEAATGKTIWENAFEPNYKDGQGGDGTRATPSVDNGLVYILGGHGLVLCVKAEDGKEVWKKKVASKPNWGYSGSVLIQGDLAIFTAGGEDGTMMAVNKKTGAPVWKCGEEPPSYSSPFPFTLKDKPYLFCFGSKAGLIADAKTGKQVARIPWETDWDVNAAEPNYLEGKLFLTSGYNTGCALYSLEPQGEQIAAKQEWKNQAMMARFTSCVLKDGKLYGGDQKALRCVDFATGKELWSDGKLPNTSVLLVGEHLIIQTERGAVLLAKADPAGFKVLGKVEPLKGRCWTVPTLANGLLYVRNLTKAVCLDLRK